jgi:hypothetical protein
VPTSDEAMMLASSEWWSSGWVVAGIWLFLLLEGLYSIGIACLIVHIFRRDVERAGPIVLKIDNPALPRRTRPWLGTSLAILLIVLLAGVAVWIALTRRDRWYSLIPAGLLVILAARQTASTIVRLKYCPPYVQIHENGLLYPAGQPLHFLPWEYVRWYDVRPYRSGRGTEFRLIVQAPAQCQNLPVREDQVAQIESCLSERLSKGERRSESESP